MTPSPAPRSVPIIVGHCLSPCAISCPAARKKEIFLPKPVFFSINFLMASMTPAPASRHRQSGSTNLPRVDCSPWRSGHLRSSRSPSRVRSNLAGKGAMGMASLSLPIPLRSNLASAPMPFFKPFGRNFPQYPPPKKPPAQREVSFIWEKSCPMPAFRGGGTQGRSCQGLRARSRQSRHRKPCSAPSGRRAARAESLPLRLPRQGPPATLPPGKRAENSLSAAVSPRKAGKSVLR